jgi:hypothetical protein
MQAGPYETKKQGSFATALAAQRGNIKLFHVLIFG